MPKANKLIKVENIPTSVTNVAKYCRNFINSVSETDIPVKMVKRVTRSKQSTSQHAQAAAVLFEMIRDKKLLLQHYRRDHYDIVVTDNTITRHVDFEKVHTSYCKYVFKPI